MRFHGQRKAAQFVKTGRLFSCRELFCLGNDSGLGRNASFGITLFLTDESQAETVKSWLAQTCQLHHSAFRVVILEAIPKNAAGKTLYAQLEALSA